MSIAESTSIPQGLKKIHSLVDIIHMIEKQFMNDCDVKDEPAEG